MWLPILAAGAALAFLFSRKGSGIRALPAGASLGDRVAQAIQRRDAKLLRALATEAPASARQGILDEARRIELAAVERVKLRSPELLKPRPLVHPELAPVVAPVAAPVVTPAPSPVRDIEDPKRQAALDLTAYLMTIGGLKGRGTESRSTVAKYQTAMGLPADGSYGRLAAATVLGFGIVPVVPFYWPKDAKLVRKAKNEFETLVKRRIEQDPIQAEALKSLLAETERS